MLIRKKIAGRLHVSIGALPSFELNEDEYEIGNDDIAKSIGMTIIDGKNIVAVCPNCNGEFGSYIEFHKHSCQRQVEPAPMENN